MKLLATLTLLSQMAFAQGLPFKSSDDLTFTPANEQKLIEMGKTKAFRGIITREGSIGSDRRMMDFYEFSSANDGPLNLENCQKHFTEVFGDPKSISLKMGKTEIYQSRRSGKVCLTPVIDPDPKALFKERHLAVFKRADKTYGLVFRFNKATTKDDTTQIKVFIDSLK